MNKVNFQTQISGKDLSSPELHEKKSASDSLPTITHNKSKRSDTSILKQSFDLFRKLSHHKSRAHVDMKLDKKIGTEKNEELSTIYIKTRTRKNVSFAKSDPKNMSPVNGKPIDAREQITRKDPHLKYLLNGLKKIPAGEDENKGNELATAVRQLFGDLGGEPDQKTLVELKTVANQLYPIPELRGASIALSKKIEVILSEKVEIASQNGEKAEKITMHAPDGAMFSAKAEKLQEPKSKLSVSDKTLNESVAAITDSKNIDEITAVIERMQASIRKIPKQTLSAAPISNLVKAEKVTMPTPESVIFSAKAEKLQEPKSMPSASDMKLMDDILNSKNLDEITNALERAGASIQNTPNQPNPVVPLSAEDELEKELGELNDQLEKLKQSRPSE